MAMIMPTSAVVGMASFAVGALVVGALVVGAAVGPVGALVVGAAVCAVGALVGDSVPEHVTPFGGAHAPVLRHAGHIAPSVHAGLVP